MAQLDQDMPKGSSVEVWRSLLHYKWLILLTTLVGGGLGYLHFIRQPPVFQSTARILIIKEQLTDELPVHTVTRPRSIPKMACKLKSCSSKSPLVIEEAVKTHHLRIASILRRRR